MSMFKPTTAKTPEDYIEQLDEPRKSQIQQIHDFIQRTVPDLTPHIKSGMIGYGTYHYTYKSGQEGDWPIIALASQKSYISMYVSCVNKDGTYLAEYYSEQLPNASVGKSCIRYKNFDQIEWSVLAEVFKQARELQG